MEYVAMDSILLRFFSQVYEAHELHKLLIMVWSILQTNEDSSVRMLLNDISSPHLLATLMKVLNCY